MTINKDNITAVILAGGKGRRLGGQDKGLVEYKNKKLIEYVLERIKPQVNTILINANRNRSTYEQYGYSVINDELSDFQGPLAGFATAMKVAKTDFIVTLPCDGPTLPKDLVSRLANALKENSKGIAVAHDGERLQPVYALIPIKHIDSLESYLESGDRKIDLWYAQHNLITVDFSDQKTAFFNINTEQQRLD